MSWKPLQRWLKNKTLERHMLLSQHIRTRNELSQRFSTGIFWITHSSAPKFWLMCELKLSVAPTEGWQPPHCQHVLFPGHRPFWASISSCPGGATGRWAEGTYIQRREERGIADVQPLEPCLLALTTGEVQDSGCSIRLDPWASAPKKSTTTTNVQTDTRATWETWSFVVTVT